MVDYLQRGFHAKRVSRKERKEGFTQRAQRGFTQRAQRGFTQRAQRGFHTKGAKGVSRKGVSRKGRKDGSRKGVHAKGARPKIMDNKQQFFKALSFLAKNLHKFKKVRTFASNLCLMNFQNTIIAGRIIIISSGK